jgi:hypothetical protein
MAVDQSWWDPTAAWWAKAARALRHIGEAGSVASAYELASPYEIRREDGEGQARSRSAFGYVSKFPLNS